jgi:hypothetical protein
MKHRTFIDDLLQSDFSQELKFMQCAFDDLCWQLVSHLQVTCFAELMNLSVESFRNQADTSCSIPNRPHFSVM